MILFSEANNIAFVTLSRPEKQNALSVDMFVGLDNAIKKIRKSKSIRAVVLQGEGAHFCAGLDVKSVLNKPSGIIKLLKKWLPGNANLVQRVVLGWQTLPVPVIAKITGNCLGGGCHIALGADIRLADSSAQFAIMEAKWGLCPDMGGSLLLPATMNKDKALLMTVHAQRIDAQQALKDGLITEICDDVDARLSELLSQFSARSPDAIAAIKKVYNRAYNQPARILLWLETWSQIKLLAAKNTKIAMKNASVADENKKPFLPRMKW
ncbi:crotonase/enoyl-CoA hydratase family protein [Pseudoalteromonas sp. Of11M-6]|uniref:crotonase/enoyl-CoA hydratase family protein n=1 Tax=Pseudoalteromonas sp. Of11M-6 TaxID=2917754 RepID=UPI001EF657D0|nr:crotonase/enoyl-CoA hydratase family protein [Pseudoalteromonas sp. Of11M-6]MCG7552344.1 crotonase/enoyl-CoA hydratase family protein [Pseudoalteromonas sp. Of11M-6]